MVISFYCINSAVWPHTETIIIVLYYLYFIHIIKRFNNLIGFKQSKAVRIIQNTFDT